MNPPVIATLPGPQAPGAAAGEGKSARTPADAQPGEGFSAVLAAVAGVAGAAGPRIPAEEKAADRAVTGLGAEALDGDGAEVATPAAAGTAPGPFPPGACHGARVTRPAVAAHDTPVRAAKAGAPDAAVVPEPLPATGQSSSLATTAPADPAPADPGAAGSGPVRSVGSPAAAASDAVEAADRALPADLGDAGGQPPAAPGGDPPSGGGTASEKARLAETPGHEVRKGAPERAKPTEGGDSAQALRPAEPPRSPRAEASWRRAGHSTGAEAAPAAVPAPAGPPPPAPVGGPARPSAPSPAVPSPVAQVVEVIKPLVRTEDGAEEVVLELRPADLGTVRVEVRIEGGVVHATLRADQDPTADLIRQSLPELRDALADAGLRPGDLGCDNGRSSGMGPGSRERPAWGRDPGREPGTPAEAALAHRPDPRSSLDLLL